ncbi:unnamed protein product [Closterium sp. NIES-53]
MFGLDKFNGDNFAEWPFKMENIFDHYDLLEVMEGTVKRPENDPEKSPWVRKSAQGYLRLGQALGSSQIHHIKPFQHEPDKGPKPWAALKGVHAPATAAVAVVLERQMAALRIEEYEAVEEGVQKFFDLLTRLEGADLKYSELQKKTKLLALLPESWSSLIINLNRDMPRLSLEDVKRAILQEDFRRRELASADGAGAGSIGRGGATYSMTPRADLLTKLEPSLVKHVALGLGQRAEVKGMGKTMFKGTDGKMVGLKNSHAQLRPRPPPAPPPPPPPPWGRGGEGVRGWRMCLSSSSCRHASSSLSPCRTLCWEGGGELGGLWSSSGGEGICSTSPPCPPLLLPPPAAGAAVGGGDLQHQPPPRPAALQLCAPCNSGGLQATPLTPCAPPLAARSPPLCSALHAALLVARHRSLPAMASLRVLTFDHEGRLIKFDTRLDDLRHLYLLSDSRDSVSLFDHTSGASLAPPTIADNATHSHWLTRDATAHLAIRNHLPLAECAHFGQHKTAKALYEAVVARNSSPATAALGRLILPYLLPELSAFATVEDLVTHLRTSDARYRAALSAEFLDKNPPAMYITLYFIVTRLPNSLRAIKDHFLALDPTDLTIDLLEQHLLVAKTSVVFGGGGGDSGGSGGSGSGRSGGGRTEAQCGGSGGGQRQRQQRRRETPSPQQLREWLFQRGASGVAIFDVDYDAIHSAMYALSFSAEGDCSRCVPPDSGIAPAALGASESGTLPGTAPAEALHTFTLDSSASRCFFCDSTTVTPLPAPVLVRLADPSGGPVCQNI